MHPTAHDSAHKTPHGPGGAASPNGSAAMPAQTFLRPIGTPLPLGLLGLAGGTTVLAGLQLGWFPLRESVVAGLILLAFAVPLQLLASVYGFLTRDSVVGSAMGVLAGTWFATGLTLLSSLPGSTSGAIGLLLVTAAVCLLVPLLSAAGNKPVASVVLLIAAARFAATGVYELSAVPGWKTVAGILGVVLGGAAVCAALAFESESGPGRKLLPTLRTGPGRWQMTEPADYEVADVHHEPGVRKAL